MAASSKIIEGINLVKLKAMQRLEFKPNTQLGIVSFGKNNLYPNEYIRLYDEHPEHRAIINRKSRYIFGKGFKAKNKEDELKVNAFIENFNRKEDLNKCGKKVILNNEIFNGCFVEIITNLQGAPIEMYFLNSAFCRLNEDKTELHFSKKWDKRFGNDDIKVVQKYDPLSKEAGTFFIDFSYYTPSSTLMNSVYPVANYQSIVEDINTDIDISTANSNYVSNGFSVGKIIHFFQGTPNDSMARDIDNRFKGTYGGENGENIMISHSDREDKAPEVVDVSVQDMAEKFVFTSKRAQKKIFAGHEMSPELFNIKFDDSFLAAAPDLILLQDLFVKGYVEPRQESFLEFLSELAFIKTGEYLEFMIEPISLIGVDLSNDVDLTQDERRKLKGYESLTAPKLDASGEPLPVQANEYNENLTGLSASENRDMQRVVRDYTQKKNGMNEHLAIARLKGYGLSESESKKILGINAGLEAKMSSQVDKVLLALEASAIDDNDEDETLLIEAAHIHNSKDALKYERHIMKFADALVISVDELDNTVLAALKGNPTLTIDNLASQLNYDSIKISESFARLTQKGLIDSNFKPTQEALDLPTDKPEVKVEIYTVYKYALKEGVSYAGNPNKISKDLLSTSHEFCKKTIGLSNGGSRWTFEALDKLSNDFDMNVWDYKGGYTMKKSGIIDPDCNHDWYAITKKRTIKK